MNDCTVVAQHPGHTVITITGDMDIATRPELMQTTQAAVMLPLGDKTLQGPCMWICPEYPSWTPAA